MPGRHGTVCCDPAKLKRATEPIAEGVSDVDAAAELGVGRRSMHRHRTNHVLAPAQAIADTAAKSRPVEARRQEVVPGAEAGTLDPADYLTLGAIVDSLRATNERLERIAPINPSRVRVRQNAVIN